MYGSWDMVGDRCNYYFSFWAIFGTFTTLTAQKIKILKKWKKTLKILSFYIRVPKSMIRWCTVPEIWGVTDVINFHFGPFFAPNGPKNQNFEKMKKTLEISSFYICAPKIMIKWCMVPEIWCMTDVIVISHFGLKNQNFEKIKKKPGDIIISHMCNKNHDQMMYGSWDILCNRQTDGRMDGQMDGWTDRWTDGRKMWHTEVGAPPKSKRTIASRKKQMSQNILFTFQNNILFFMYGIR